jgi:hypothetical protein
MGARSINFQELAGVYDYEYDDDVYLDNLQTRGVKKCISSACET